MSAISDGIGSDGVEQLDENLRKWFKEKWVRFGPDGKIRGACARGDDSEGKPKCLPQKKAQSLGKKGRKYAAAKKRREDPNPERRGKAKNVATKKKSNEDIQVNEKWSKKYKDSINCSNPKGFSQKAHCAGKKKNEAMNEGIPFNQCPECRGPIVHESMINEKKDACYHKVKARYKVWPSAYASGALVQCRKKGASNWGTGGKKNESNIMKGIVDEASGTPGGLERYRTPAMVNATMQQSLYKRELAPIKRAEKLAKQKAYRDANPQEPVKLMKIGAGTYPIPVIQNWIDTQDINNAMQFASNKFGNKQSKEFKAELLSDPKFKEAFINLLNVGADNLTARNTMAKNKGSVSSDYRSEEQTSAGYDAVNKINDILLSYYKKFGVDKTGRRVPPGFNYALGEAKAKQYVKPYNSPQTGEQIGWVSSDGHHKKYWQVFAKDSAIKHAKLNPDEVQEDYTGEFAAEKTPAINPYGGLKDRQHRGAISETPTDNPTGASGEGGWRKYKPKSAGTFKEEELDEACWKGYHKEGNKKMFGKTYPNCVKNTNEEKRLDKNKMSEYNIDDMLEKVEDYNYRYRDHPKRTLLTKLYNIVYHLKRYSDSNTISRDELKLTPWLGKHGLELLDTIMDNTSKEEQLDEKCWDSHKQVGMKNKGGKQVPNCVPKESAIMKGLRK